MRLRDLGMLVLSLLIVSWGIPATARADDVQQSHYSVMLTKPKSDVNTNLNGGDGALIDGDDGDTVNGRPNGNSHSSATTSPNNTNANTNGGQGATVSPVNSQAAKRSSKESPNSLTGRLPQTSEEWFGFGTMAGVILLLLVWIGILVKRRKQQN